MASFPLYQGVIDDLDTLIGWSATSLIGAARQRWPT
jgi:hypothetical protein